ncbi:glycosyltransferase 87 family protein [Corynebacterium felinum]|uniref:Alpha-1,2-mannosyltransferase n=1 Tax=Corynebacterium felinum TaxID=131318 RepID=A0ABU2BBZ9_9CORY|nr:glycosyltransferase 87 family protein [Corynebacterium felinum]MDF5821325.1 glycosyltransferase 87 family protein [Corynebacterium felinum]MDR7356157.1 alpha-1,2-mannosyltransferase [Corynebacterium felinum]
MSSLPSKPQPQQHSARHLGRVGASISTMWVPALIIISCTWVLTGRYMVDLDVYRLGAHALLDGDNLYHQVYRTLEAPLPFTYPPFAALVFSPLAWLGLPIATPLFTCVSLLSLYASIRIVARSYPTLTLFTHPWGKVGLFVLALCTGAVHSTLLYGQINLVLLLFVVYGCLGCAPHTRARLIGGVLVGIAAAIKLTPGFFVLYFLARRNYAAIIGMCLGFGAATLVAYACAPDSSIDYFTHVLFDAGRIGAEHYTENHSLKASLSRAGLSNYWPYAAIITTALAYFAARNCKAQMSFCIIAFALLAVSPVSWVHHWVWLVPCTIILYAHKHYVLTIWAVCTSTLFSYLDDLLPHSNHLELQWTFLQQLAGSHDVGFALCVIIVCAVHPQTTHLGAYSTVENNRINTLSARH